MYRARRFLLYRRRPPADRRSAARKRIPPAGASGQRPSRWNFYAQSDSTTNPPRHQVIFYAVRAARVTRQATVMVADSVNVKPLSPVHVNCSVPLSAAITENARYGFADIAG